MQHYKNAIETSLLEETADKLVLDIIPPPEYHLFEHHVTIVADVLFKNEALANFLHGKTVIRHGYNGGGLDDPNCKKNVELIR